MNVVKYLIIAVAVFLVMPTIGCSGRFDLTEVTARAIVATLKTQSYRTSAVGTYAVDGESGGSIYETEFAAPDSSHTKTSSGGTWSEVISIGENSYLRSSEKPYWCQSPCQYDDGSSAQATSISLEKQLEPLNWLVDLKQLPNEEVDGVNCWHYQGKVDMDSYVDTLKEAAETKDWRMSEQQTDNIEEMRSRKWNFKLWVEKDTYLMRQLKDEMSLTMVNPDTGEESLFTGNTTMRFYDFNRPISIEPPQM